MISLPCGWVMDLPNFSFGWNTVIGSSHFWGLSLRRFPLPYKYQSVEVAGDGHRKCFITGSALGTDIVVTYGSFFPPTHVTLSHSKRQKREEPEHH